MAAFYNIREAIIRDLTPFNRVLKGNLITLLNYKTESK